MDSIIFFFEYCFFIVTWWPYLIILIAPCFKSWTINRIVYFSCIIISYVLVAGLTFALYKFFKKIKLKSIYIKIIMFLFFIIGNIGPICWTFIYPDGLYKDTKQIVSHEEAIKNLFDEQAKKIKTDGATIAK